jgi:pimeloyl-ACP methyl ester carboxylesterase
MSFVLAAEWLTPHFRVILPAVPGFGETARDPTRPYSIGAQVETLHAAFQKIGLTRFHLGGNSMGGHIAAAYALCYPDEVIKLVLIDAAGIRVGDDVPYQGLTDRIRTLADFDRYMDRLFVEKPPMPRPVKTYLAKQFARNFDWNNRIAADIRNGPYYLLNDSASNIEIPTFILWGDRDQIVKPEVGLAYHQAIAGSEIITFADCGHCPQYERPRETAEAILRFLKNAPSVDVVAPGGPQS